MSNFEEEKAVKIEKEVKEIIENFMEKLKDVNLEVNEEDFYLIKNNELRKEVDVDEKESEKEFIKTWKKTWNRFDEENYLMAEKAKWKK